MSKKIPGQDRIPGLSTAKRRGRVRNAVAREIADARARGTEVSTASVTVAYVIADLIDHIDQTGEDRYLLPQLVARLLEERKAASLLPQPVGDDATIWAEFSAAMVGMEPGNAQGAGSPL